MNTAITQSPWLEQLGWTLLHFLWQGVLVASLLAAALAGLRGCTARIRYLVSVAGALAAGLLPLATLLVLPLPPTASSSAAALQAKTAYSAARDALRPAVPVSRPVPPSAEPTVARPTPARQLTHPSSPIQNQDVPTLARIYSTLASEARPWLPWLAAAWTLGVAGLSFRLLTGWTQVQRLRRRGVAPADAYWQARLQTLAARLGVRRAVRLLESTLAEVPAVIGWLRPVILLPVGVLAGLSTIQVEMILAHELAHIRRQDYLVNLGLALFETLGFYHPAVWWIARCVRTEREHVCDDLAVSAGGGDRLGYVRALATLEEMRGPAGQFALAASGGGRGLLLARVRRLLGITVERRPRAGRTTWWLAGIITLLSAMVIMLGGVQRPALAQEVPSKKQPPAPESLRGRVVDEAGRPVEGALVYDDASHDKTIEYPPGPLVTDADGGFRVPKQRFPGQWRFIGTRLGDTSVGWLDIGAGRQPAAFGADNVLTRPVVLRSRRFALRGTCVDEAGQPVAGATVAVTSLPAEGSDRFNWQPSHPEESIYHFWEALTTRSDAAGNFSLPVPLEEGMSVEIRAPGRQTVEPFQTVKAGMPPVTNLGRVTLKAAGSIAGRIVFQPAGSGEPRPLKDALLQAVNATETKKADPLGPKEYDNVPFSDAQGRYRIEHLPPGTYTVFLFGLSPEDPSKEPVRMAAVENVVVRAGETTALDLRTVPGKRLRVRAEDPATHQPARDLAVHFVGPSRPVSSGLNMGDALYQGEWTLTVAPGHYRVFLSSGYGPNSPEVASAEVDVPTDRDPDPVLLQVKSEPHLRGKVQDARGKFIPLGSASVVLLETSPAPGRQEGGGQSSNGTFDIPLTRSGYRARLAVDMPGYRAFVSLEFVVAERPEPMTVTLEEATALTVTGRALDQDGKPMARAYVSGQIVVTDGLHYNVRLGNGIPDIELQTDEDGRFETRRFREGDRFQVFVYGKDGAVAESADWPWTHPASGGVFRLDMKARPATRPPTTEASVGPRDLVGHVVNAQGNPVAGAIVTLSGTPSDQDPGVATTNTAGGFRFPEFGDRHYVYLAVAKEGYATHWETDLTVGRDFTVRLDDRTRLRGQLRLPDGTRASYARLVLRTSRPTKRPFMGNPIGNLRLDRQADLQGFYDFPAEPGEYEVQIKTPDGSFVARYESVQVVAEQVNTLPTALSAALTLRVQAVDRVTGQPAVGVKFAIREMSDATAMEIRPGSRKQTDAQGFVQWDGLLPGTVELNTRENDIYQRVWSRDDRQTYPEKFPVDRPPQGNESSLGQLMLKLDPARADEPVVMQVERGVKVSGAIVDAAGKPAINVQLRAVVDRTGQKDGQPSGDLVPFYAYEQDGTLHGYLPASNGLPTRINARPQDIGQGVTLSDPFDSRPGDERHVTIHLNRGATVEGRVVDAEGKGLPNVNVAATPLDHLDSFDFTPWATTDAQGRFRFEHVRPTEYEVTTTIVPHLSVGKEPPQEKRRLLVADGEHARLSELHFVPAGWTGSAADSPIGPRDLAGRTVDAQGQPIAGVLVTIEGAYPTLAPATTDAQGRFRFADFGDRHYIELVAEKADYGMRLLTDLTVGRDFEVRMENSTRLRGTFLRPDGGLAGPATVVLRANRTTRRPNMGVSGYRLDRKTDEQGAYDFPVEPGEYEVEITADRENLVARHEKFVVPPDRATALPEALQTGLTLTIRTVDSATGQPAPGAHFYLREQKNSFTIGPRPGSERQTDAQGFARWDHLFSGPVFLDVNQDPTYARFWSADAREHHQENAPKTAHPTRDQGADGSLYVDVLPGRGDDPVVIRTERGVIVSGRVLDPQSRPVGGVQVNVLMSGPAGKPGGEDIYGLTGFPNSTVTAADGTFSGWCIPAGNGGRTYLVADDHRNTPDYTLGNGHSDPFPSAPGDKREVYIRLTTGGWIEGSVVDAHGQPLANVPVAAAVLDHLDGYANHIGPKTDTQGHFRIGPLRPAEYEVRARGADWDWDHPEPPEEKCRVTVPASETVQTGPLHFDPAGWTAPPPPPPDHASIEPAKQSPSVASTATPTPPDARTLVFRVAERETNRPIPDAELRILGDCVDEKPVHTDAAGACVIPLLETPHSLCVRVRKPGFVPMRVDWHLSQPAFRLPAEYTMTLEPGTSIGGTILDEDNRPVANATVILILRGSSAGGIEEVFPDIWEERVTTDAQGKWGYDAAPSVLRYPSVAVEHPDYVRHDSHAADRPTVENLRDRSSVIRLQRGVRVEGRITDPAGQGIAGAVILPGESRMDSTTKPEHHADDQGRFVIAHALPGSETLTVKAEGYAPEIIDASFSRGMEPLHVTLQPGRVLRVRVVDAEGKGLAGVMVAADTWRKRRTLETDLTTDADGRAEWKSAPPDAVQFDVLKADYQAARSVVLTAAADEQTITLRRPLRVNGAVTDARTGQPIREFRVIPGVVTPKNYQIWSRSVAHAGTDGRYVQAFDEPAALAGQHLLRVEADGYRSAVSRRIDDAEGSVTLDFSLEPGGGLAGRILAPDGSPAAGAKIGVAFPGDPISVQDGVPDHDANHIEVAADAQGRFQLPSQEPPYLLVVTHPAGYARLTAEEFAVHPDIGLAAWGRVEVAVTPISPPAPGHRLPFYLTDQRPDGSGPAGESPVVYNDPKARLAENGATVYFDHVPPGDWWLDRYGQATNCARPVRVAAGETTRLSLLGERSISGRLNTAAVHEAVDLTQCRVLINLKLPPPPVPEGLAATERQAWFKEWFKTDAGMAYHAAGRTYFGEMTEDGVFRCDGVPSGKEYELRIMLLEAGQDPRQPRLVLSGSKQFLLPEGKAADDLGEVQAQSPAAEGK